MVWTPHPIITCICMHRDSRALWYMLMLESRCIQVMGWGVQTVQFLQYKQYCQFYNLNMFVHYLQQPLKLFLPSLFLLIFSNHGNAIIIMFFYLSDFKSLSICTCQGHFFPESKSKDQAAAVNLLLLNDQNNQKNRHWKREPN